MDEWVGAAAHTTQLTRQDGTVVSHESMPTAPAQLPVTAAAKERVVATAMAGVVGRID